MGKTVEETYQKKTPKEHILLRPDTYIGSVDRDTQMMYVWDATVQRIVQRSICYAPGLYKIFDEILVNAADNKIRDPRMSILRVDIDSERNEISIYNNGRGIPIAIHGKEGVYVPELIFGHLLTSSNYDDAERKVTGGRNGYGAKLCNIFSTEFTVDTSDGRQRYVQRFTGNMDVTHPPAITASREEYTKITFSPDLARFKMDSLDDGVVSLLTRRVYDVCGTLNGVRVFLNGEELQVRNFKDYVRLYVGPDDPVVHQRISARWELAFTVAEEQFTQVSFVNSIATTKGGTHIQHVLDQLLDPIIDAIRKKEKTLEIKPIHVRSGMFLFVNALIENPSFDSQTKEHLTLRASSFGSCCEGVESFVKEILRSTSLAERVLSFSRARQSAQLKKTDGAKTARLSGIPKLEDANNAGTRRSAECTLILTEGDSAKTLAVAGLSIVGRDSYGVFPLRGKLLNVREANHQQILANAEISNIKKILGLQHGRAYEDASTLRYGHIMIMTDQDHDGSHIKGLIINFLDHFYPSLLGVRGFLQEFITPIIRITRKAGKTKGRETGASVRDFFTIPEFETWKAQEQAAHNGRFDWSVKYYKGLGTSTPKDARQYFSDLQRHVKDFVPVDEDDRNLIDLAFNKKKADLRKAWLADFVPGTFLDQSASSIAVRDFINRELILFSIADNTRSIPSVVDGLKPGQRKVLFCCFKRSLRSEIKVAQLVGYVSEQSAYHHGEVSLCGTIVNLAHDFVGSNNVNLLLPLGSFGSRLQGGKDAASPRYIYTALSPLARLLFPEQDDPILNYLTDDNLSIEPEFYVPILPMVLVNGADGIGTGWSTSIPNYNPLDIVKAIRSLLRNDGSSADGSVGGSTATLAPWYRNFRGTVRDGSNGRFTVEGTHETSDGLISVTELPVGTWTQTYKEYLESLVQSGTVHDYKQYHTEKTVDFLISPVKSFPLKLATTISTSNMICFDPAGKIKRYSSPMDIINEFYPVRLRYYVLRKEYRLKAIKEELVRLSNKVRFISEVSSGELVISRRPVAEITADLVSRGYAPISGIQVGGEIPSVGGSKVDSDFEYLLSMRIASLTRERMEKLKEELDRKQAEYDVLSARAPADIWDEDLTHFEAAYNKLLEDEIREYDQELSKKVRRHVPKARKAVSLKNNTAKDGKTAKGKDAKKEVKEKKTKKETKGTKSSAVTPRARKAKPAAAAEPKKKAAVPKKKSVPANVADPEPIPKKRKQAASDAFTVVSSDSSEGEKPWNKYREGKR